MTAATEELRRANLQRLVDAEPYIVECHHQERASQRLSVWCWLFGHDWQWLSDSYKMNARWITRPIPVMPPCFGFRECRRCGVVKRSSGGR